MVCIDFPVSKFCVQYFFANFPNSLDSGERKNFANCLDEIKPCRIRASEVNSYRFQNGIHRMLKYQVAWQMAFNVESVK